jgi:hypothetical protein
MATKPTQRFHIELDLRELDDEDRYNLVTGILAVAPQSALAVRVAAFPATLASLAAQAAALKADNATVAGLAKQLAAEMSARDTTRVALDNTILTTRTLVETNAVDATDIAGSGFKQRDTRAPRLPLLPPASIDVKLGRIHGRFRVSAHETGTTRRHYAVEICLDPIGPNAWMSLPGDGKARTVTGYPSGTRVWIRYAMTRGQAQSDWSTPVLVTVP